MKVAVLSESPADEAAIRILVDGILGEETELPPPFRLRSRGWPSVRGILSSVIKHFQYQTDADGLAVVVDANGSPLDDPCAGEVAKGARRSRVAELHEVIEGVRGQLKQVPGRETLRVAVGVAAPAIEAWYLCGVDPGATETSWMRELAEGTQARGKILSLKRQVYGTDRYSIALETERAVEHARRLAKDLNLLEKHFPAGFGTFAKNVRSWAGAEAR
ncbi:MAG TPA: hypothetical protein VM243_08780 [Phycisphaerae bacterium]|nr:hypothetical protein [Phycisphaerae bacterium]